jgi:hypothetical protein
MTSRPDPAAELGTPPAGDVAAVPEAAALLDVLEVLSDQHLRARPGPPS